MATFQHYIDTIDVKHNDFSYHVAYASKHYIFLGGFANENSNTSVLVIDKTNDVQSLEDLKVFAEALTTEEFSNNARGSITLSLSDECTPRLDKIIEHIQDTLEHGHELGYALRSAALSQFNRYKNNPEEAHLMAIEPANTLVFLLSQNQNYKITYTPDSKPKPEHVRRPPDEGSCFPDLSF